MRDIWTRPDLPERARLIFAASVGELSVTEACGKLGVSRQRFYELESRAIEAFIRETAPKPAGRPPKPIDPAFALQREIGKLKSENERLWLYIKVLQRLAGIESVEKKRGAAPRTSRRRGETHDR